MFTITPLIESGSWTVNKPSIIEIRSQGTRFDYTNADDPELLRVIRHKRVIAIQLPGTTVDELGLGRGRNGTGYSDTYSILIKAGSQQDAENIYNNFRNIIINIPVTEAYNRLEIDTLEQYSRRGCWFISFMVTAYRKGKVRETS